MQRDKDSLASFMRILWTALIYGVVAYVNVRLDVKPENASAVWFPAGILIAKLLRRPFIQWPFIALICTSAAIPADLSVNRTLAESVVMNLANAIGFCSAAYLIRKFTGPNPTFLRFRDSTTILWTVITGSVLAGVVAGGGMAVLGHPELFVQVVRVFSIACSLGCLTVMPVIFCWRRSRAGDLFGIRPFEGTLLFTATVVVTSCVFFLPETQSALALSLVFVPLVLLFVYTLRRPLAEVSLLLLAFAILTSVAIHLGTGPASALQLTGTDRVLWLNGLVGLSVSTLIVLGSMNDERRRALHRLQIDRTRATRKADLRTADLRRAVSDLESFAYSVSHDLRTPLRGLNLHIQLLEEEIGNKVTAPMQDSLDAIHDRVDSMNRIINGLLRLARAQRKGLMMTRVDAQELVLEILANNPHMDDDGVRIDVGPMPDCYGDRDLLRQVFENLLSNALKYGSLARNPLIEVEGVPIDGGVLYQVRDNGPGFDPQMIDSVFEVFQRAHGKKRLDSEGVGLAIVKHIVGRHGGRVQAQTTPGMGATFSVWLSRIATLGTHHSPEASSIEESTGR